MHHHASDLHKSWHANKACKWRQGINVPSSRIKDLATLFVRCRCRLHDNQCHECATMSMIYIKAGMQRKDACKWKQGAKLMCIQKCQSVDLSTIGDHRVIALPRIHIGRDICAVRLGWGKFQKLNFPQNIYWMPNFPQWIIYSSEIFTGSEPACLSWPYKPVLSLMVSSVVF